MFGFLAATFLRLNNVGMVERRDAVLAADREGDDVLLEKRLYDLQRYVTSHMNADPGRIPLDGKYQRDNEVYIEKRMEEISATAGNDVTAKVREYCDAIGQREGWRWTTSADPRYVACISEQYDKYPAASEIEEPLSLPTEPYYHTFVSPLWSPDFAGWTLVVCGVISMTIIFRLIALASLKIIMRFKYRRL